MTSHAFFPLMIMSLGAPLGAIDVLYFHIWKFRLHARPESRAETVTHVIRGLCVGIVVLVLANYEPHGMWSIAVTGVMVVDAVNNVMDATLEKKSRRALGGLPRAEYVIHIVGSMAAGAFAAAYIAVVLEFNLMGAPTGLVSEHGLPPWLVWNADAVGVGGVALAILEALLLVRAWPRADITPEPAT